MDKVLSLSKWRETDIFDAREKAALNHIVSLTWESQSNRSYNIEVSSNLIAWTPLAGNLMATGASCTFQTNISDASRFFRVYRAP